MNIARGSFLFLYRSDHLYKCCSLEGCQDQKKVAIWVQSRGSWGHCLAKKKFSTAEKGSCASKYHKRKDNILKCYSSGYVREHDGWDWKFKVQDMARSGRENEGHYVASPNFDSKYFPIPRFNYSFVHTLFLSLARDAIDHDGDCRTTIYRWKCHAKWQRPVNCGVAGGLAPPFPSCTLYSCRASIKCVTLNLTFPLLFLLLQ